MAFYIPSQIRAVDPYSSYNSDNVNQITRILSSGEDIVSKGMDIVIGDSTSLIIAEGTAIKDDVMINIQEDVTIDFTDATWFVEGTAMDLTDTGYLYVVVDYTYVKQATPATASYKILKTTTALPSQYLFIKAVKLNTDGAEPYIEELFDYDPDHINIVKQSATIQITVVDALPPWSSSQLGLMYLYDSGSKIAIGNTTDWVYFSTDSTSTTYASVTSEGSLPAWQASDYGRIIQVGDNVYQGSESKWIELSHTSDASIYRETIDSTSFVLVSGFYEYDVIHNLTKDTVNIQCSEVINKAIISPNTIILTDSVKCKIKFSVVPDDINIIITG